MVIVDSEARVEEKKYEKLLRINVQDAQRLSRKTRLRRNNSCNCVNEAGNQRARERKKESA